MPVHDEDVHAYDQTHFRLDKPALHLVSLLLADKELQRAYRSGTLEQLAYFAEEEKKSEVIRLTIEIATTYRLMFWNAEQKPSSNAVGRLCADESSNSWTDLPMLEACHKVIHAEFFAFESRRFSKDERSLPQTTPPPCRREGQEELACHNRGSSVRQRFHPTD
jgi:hypothetical protein